MLNASIVLYNHSLAEIKPLVEILRKSTLISVIFLIDNSPTKQPDFNNLEVTYIFNNKNIGYGAATILPSEKPLIKTYPIIWLSILT